MNKDEAVQKIINWGKINQSVDALLLTGSLASKNKIDELSDIDIAVFGHDFTFIQNDTWLSEIGDTWLAIHDQFNFEKYVIPTRLIIFNGGLKIDFSFHPVEILTTLSTGSILPDAYKNGYKILLDKTGLTHQLYLPDHKAFLLNKPGIEAFQNNEKEFWFECYHVAKYLKRNDLWTAKFRDNDVKKWLLQMLEWHHLTKQEENFSPKLYGREIQSWIDKSLWDKLHNCYSGFEKKHAWKAINNAMQLYRFVAKETAAHYNFNYNDILDLNISTYIKKLWKDY